MSESKEILRKLAEAILAALGDDKPAVADEAVKPPKATKGKKAAPASLFDDSDDDDGDDEPPAPAKPAKGAKGKKAPVVEDDEDDEAEVEEDLTEVMKKTCNAIVTSGGSKDTIKKVFAAYVKKGEEPLSRNVPVAKHKAALDDLKKILEELEEC